MAGAGPACGGLSPSPAAALGAGPCEAREAATVSAAMRDTGRALQRPPLLLRREEAAASAIAARSLPLPPAVAVGVQEGAGAAAKTAACPRAPREEKPGPCLRGKPQPSAPAAGQEGGGWECKICTEGIGAYWAQRGSCCGTAERNEYRRHCDIAAATRQLRISSHSPCKQGCSVQGCSVPIHPCPSLP